MENYRVNITSKITGKLQDGKVILYHNHAPIGEMLISEGNLNMYEGFELQESHVYANGTYVYEDQYAQNCDIGWC